MTEEENQDSTTTSYKIVRFKQNEASEVIATGLTLDEAKEHCNDPGTKGYNWFDGWVEE